MSDQQIESASACDEKLGDLHAQLVESVSVPEGGEAQRGALQPTVAGPVERFDDVHFARNRRSLAPSAISARDL